MRQHRRQRAVKHPVQKRLAFGLDTLGLRQQGPVEIGAALLVETERALVDQPRQERADGFGMPFPGLFKPGQNQLSDFIICKKRLGVVDS